MRYAHSATGSIYPLDVEYVVLHNIEPTNYMHCNVRTLVVAASGADCKNFAGLDQLERLFLFGCPLPTSPVVRNFRALTKLPKLKTIFLDFEMTPQLASEVLDAMECMPNVVVDHRVGDFFDARNTLQNILLAKRMLATRRIVAGCMTLGLALVVGMAALHYAVRDVLVLPVKATRSQTHVF